MLNTVLYGSNGHQLSAEQVKNTDGARLYGVCGVNESAYPGAKRFADLDEILQDRAVGLVCVCSARRDGQGKEILRLVEASKHVYAEKPFAMDNAEIDEILSLARKKGVFAGEMCGTSFDEPYFTVKKILEEGRLGEVVQVYVQKSYPYGDWRAQDEGEDGGLLRQNAIHALRVLFHTLSLRPRGMRAVQTGKGNRREGGLRMAASMLFSFENGAVATVNANYLNPENYGCWGNERLIVFCERGSIEADTMTNAVTVCDDKGKRILKCGEGQNYFQLVADYLNGRGGRPIPEALEFMPTKSANMLRENAAEAETR